jgi:hypothetical protein
VVIQVWHFVKTNGGLEGTACTAAAKNDAGRSRVQQRHAAHQTRLMSAVHVITCKSQTITIQAETNKHKATNQSEDIERQLVRDILRLESKKEAARVPFVPQAARSQQHRLQPWPAENILVTSMASHTLIEPCRMQNVSGSDVQHEREGDAGVKVWFWKSNFPSSSHPLPTAAHQWTHSL